MNCPARQAWQRQFARRRTAYRGARVLAALLLWLTVATGVVLALLAADYAFGFEPAVLAGLGRGSVGVLALLLMAWLGRAVAVGPRQMAVELDRRTREARQPFLAAFELAAARPPTNSLQAYLADRALDQAAARLRALPLSATLPMSMLLWHARVCSAAMAAAALLLMLPGPVTGLLIARYLHPDADLPPFSRYTFRVQPAAPVVVYGDDAELAVEIGGPGMPSGVHLLTRVNGVVQGTPCFAEGPRRYAQRIERVTAPVEFCFAIGRARSHWYRVAVNLEPRIAVARFTVTAPGYSHQPVRAFVAGEAPLQALPGSRVRLELTCNRPLSDGTLALTPAAGPATPQAIHGTRVGRHVVRFEWVLAANASLAATVRDLQGTPNREPYRLKQLVQPDARPTAVLAEPPPYALATPTSVLKLAGYAEDDLGLRRVDLVRGLSGYHDRVHGLGPASEVARLELGETLDLGRLGVVPGQMLEFFIEATDTNPDESGRVASDMARVEIVSDEDYAQMLRERLDAEQFMARFQAAANAIQSVQEALRATQSAMTNGAAGLGEQRRELAAALARAQAVVHALATDFAIYDLETEARDAFRETDGALARAQAALQQAGDDPAALAAALAAARRELGAADGALRPHAEQARHVADIARVLELEEAYRQLVAAQAELARRYQRYSDPARIQDPAFFNGVADEQGRLAAALNVFEKALRERADALPAAPELADLRRSARAFADAIDQLGIPGAMAEATQAAVARDGAGSREKVEQVLERLRKLLKQQNEQGGFAQECRRPRFCPTDAQNRTLQQLRQGRRPGIGTAMGLGWGGAGDGDDADGYSAGAVTPINTPMIGPPRAVMANREGRGPGDNGRGGAGLAVAHERASEPMAGADAARGEGAVRLDEVPDKYRDALKTYFDTLENRP